MVEDPAHPGTRAGDEATRHAIFVVQVGKFVPGQAFGKRDVFGVVPEHRRERTAQHGIIRVVLWSFHCSCLSNGQNGRFTCAAGKAPPGRLCLFVAKTRRQTTTSSNWRMKRVRKAARACQVLILEALGVTVRASRPRMRTQGPVSDPHLNPGLRFSKPLFLLCCSRSFPRPAQGD